MGEYDKQTSGQYDKPAESTEQSDRRLGATKKIGRVEYRVMPLGALKELDLLPKVIAVFGESLGLAGDAMLSYASVDFVNMGRAFDTMAVKFAQAGGSDFIVDLLSSTSIIEGESLTRLSKEKIDNWFNGHLRELFAVCLFSLDINYGDLVFTNPEERGAFTQRMSGVLSSLLTAVNKVSNTSGSD